MNYYPFHIGDYLSATRHLSWEEDAAYRRLLDTYYTTEKPLPVELRAVCRLVLATTESQRESVRVVLDEFFKLTNSGWVSSRADSEIASMRDKQQKQRDKANKRWNKPSEEPGNAPAMPQHNENDAVASKNDADAMPPTPTPTPVKEKPPLPPKGDDADFVSFWEAYPKKDGKGYALKAWEKARKKKTLPHIQAVLLAIEREKQSLKWLKDGGQFIPNPATWINGQGWENGTGQNSGGAENDDRFAKLKAKFDNRGAVRPGDRAA